MDDAETCVNRWLAKAAIERVAAEELPLFEPTADAFFAAGGRLPRSRGNSVLGFGAGDVTAFLTPFALALASYAVSLLREMVETVVNEIVKAAIKDTLGKRASPQSGGGEPTDPIVLPADQATAFREKVLEWAVGTLSLPQDRAKRLADAVIDAVVRHGP